MSGPPTTMKALVENQDLTAVVVADVPVPKLEDGEVLVKVEYVAQNPTDWKHHLTRSPAGAILGCDFMGHVVEVSPGGQRSHLRINDRVAGVVHGGLFPDKGSFAEYLRVPADLCFVVPESLSGQDAATFGVPYMTTFHALVLSQQQPWPPGREDQWILIYGGSTGVGLFALQVAKLMGYKVATTSSPHNFDLVKQYGADFVADYKKGDAAIEEIKQVTGGGVRRALDCISETQSQSFSIQCFADKGGEQLNILLFPDEAAQKLRPDVKIVSTLMYTFFGKAFDFGPREGPKMPLPQLDEDRKFHAELCRRTPEYISTFGIRAPPVEVRGGLDAIPQGFLDMQNNKVSGTRLVYKVGQ